MPIPDYKLETWSRQGAIDASKRTHEAIRKALGEWDDLRNRDYEVYLQGSYKNSTNIRADSDVDVIAQMNDSFYFNRNDLPPDQQQALDQAYDPATHSLAGFRKAVLAALRKHFGRSYVFEGNKAIKILPASGRLPADVVVCQQYRRYSHFRSLADSAMADGIRFRTRDGREIINYPKPHYQNGVSKNDQCFVSYKAGVRVFKNARNAVIERGWIQPSSVPSYFLECFAYNASNYCYAGSWRNLYLTVLDELNDASKYPEYMCQNRVRPLFGDSYDQWNYSSAIALVHALQNLWRTS